MTLKKTIAFCTLAAFLCGFTINHYRNQYEKQRITKLKQSDEYARDRIVMLISPKGECSGVVIEGPKTHKTYVLTAAHCIEIALNQNAFALDNRNRRFTMKIVENDLDSDLLLLSIDKRIDGLMLADTIEMHQHVHTMTHGGGKPTYRTDGEYLGKFQLVFPIKPIFSKEDEEACQSRSNQRVMPYILNIDACFAYEIEGAATASIIPGSSGGALLNENNELVGIASVTDGQFSYFVTLSDIQRFLASR